MACCYKAISECYELYVISQVFIFLILLKKKDVDLLNKNSEYFSKMLDVWNPELEVTLSYKSSAFIYC